jgi:hypothetical protein
MQLAKRAVVVGAVILVGLGVTYAAWSRSGSASESAVPSEAVPGEDVAIRIDSEVVRVSEAQRDIDAMPPIRRAIYQSPEEREAYVKKWVQTEILFRKAQHLGFERDPEVQRALKRAMVLRLVKERIGNEPEPGEVTDAAIEQYYRTHLRDFSRPEEVRITQIVLKTKAEAIAVLQQAQRLAAEVGSRPGLVDTSAQESSFRELVFRHSEDPRAKMSGGDVSLSSESDPAVPPGVAQAAYRLQHPGEVSPIIEADGRFFILRLREHVRPFTTSLAEARPRVHRRVVEQIRDRKVDELVAEISEELNVHVHSDRLAALRFEPTEEELHLLETRP